MSRSHIQRSKYTPRNLKGLDGVIELEMVVESEYLHVSQRKDVRLIKSISNVGELVEKALKGEWPNVEGYFSREAFLLNRQGDKVVIPGSTIKGLVRSRLELSIPGSCYIVSKPSTSSSEVYKRIFHPARKESDKFDPEKYPEVCPVCNLLGNSGLASRVSFSDFVMTSGEVKYVTVFGAEYEVVTKGSRFSGKVVYKSIKSEDELGMLLYGFGFRQDGSSKTLLLGRFKFSDKRFGRVRFFVKNLNLDAVKRYVSKFQSIYHPLDFKEDW